MNTIRSIVFFLILSTIMIQLVSGTKFKPYISLAVGFMLIAMVMNPVLNLLGKEVSMPTISDIDIGNEISFESQAKDELEKQTKNQINRIMEQEKIEIEDVVVECDEQGNMQSVDITCTNKKKEEKEIKRILINVYNLKESNINISE